MAPSMITFIGARNPAYWFQPGSKLSSRFWRIACSALGLAKVKVSRGNSELLSKKLSVEGRAIDEYNGKYVFVASAHLGGATIHHLPLPDDEEERTYAGKFNVPSDVLLTAMKEVGKGTAMATVSGDDVSVTILSVGQRFEF
jgi:hypothetical protein